MAIVDKLLPLAFSTIDLIAIPAVTSVNSKPPSAHKASVNSRLKENIDVCDILSLVHRVSLCCAQSRSTEEDAKVKFWKKAEYDFVLLMLNVAQPLEQIDLMLQILCTSSLPDSIGAALDQPDPVRQTRKEAVLLDLLTYLLIEKPVPPPDPEPVASSKSSSLPFISSRTPPDTSPHPLPSLPSYSSTEIAQLRYSVVTVLATFIHHSHGGRALATHRTTLGRLVSFVHDAFKSLYSLNPMIPVARPKSSASSLLTSSSSTPVTSPVRAATIASVNMGVRILYHVFTQYADLVNVREKLAAVPGAAQKHLVALGRIAFCEGVASAEGGEDSDAGDEQITEGDFAGDWDGDGDDNESENGNNGGDAGDKRMDVDPDANDREDGSTRKSSRKQDRNRNQDQDQDQDRSTGNNARLSSMSVMEEGIEEEVVEAAHMMLEEFLTPEEGEALVAAFVPDVGRGRGSGGAGAGAGGRPGSGSGSGGDDDGNSSTDDADDNHDDGDASTETADETNRLHAHLDIENDVMMAEHIV